MRMDPDGGLAYPRETARAIGLLRFVPDPFIVT